jgi:hypothetical protein
MNKFNVGDRVVCIYSGDKGVVSRYREPTEEDEGLIPLWVVWETGTFAGKELWGHECDCILEDEYDPEDYPEHNM